MATTENQAETRVLEGREDVSVGVERYFTQDGVEPFEAVEWETRTAMIPGKDGPSFEQKDVEFPSFWSQTATNIVAQKYFRGKLNTPQREHSVRQMIGRVADTITAWGIKDSYFLDQDEADTFHAELTHLLLHQMVAFNSPVWFNVGFEEHPQCSACQPYSALVSTPDGMVPIGELVQNGEVGREVYDASGTTRVVAVKANGKKPVWRVTLRNGSYVEATADHVVKAVAERRTTPQWLRVDELVPGMRMHLHPHRARIAQPALVAAGSSGRAEDPAGPEATLVAEAALAGWLQADGFVGQYEGTNRSLTIEFMTANDDEFAWVTDHLDTVFPDVHRHVRDVETQSADLTCRRIRLYGEELRPFVEGWGLMARGTDVSVPARLWSASTGEVAAYLQSIFQADGYVSLRRDAGYENARVEFAVIGERWVEEVQLLLGMLGIYSRRLRKSERREDRHDVHVVSVAIGSERARFTEMIGFIGRDKQAKLIESLSVRGLKRCGDLCEEEIVSIEPLGVEEVYDIQTESGEYLSNNIAVHNCFILSVEDSMDSILDWITKEGRVFRGGSGSGINLSKLRSSKEQLSKGGYASGPVSFMRGADASAGTIKSGGKTRRAAKMVVLNVDHPDIEEFIWCKQHEEEKARVLQAAGYDMSLDSPDWASIQYQNANNSVRVTDEFMRAVIDDEEWHLTARTDGSVVSTVRARDLMHQISEAAWKCADPGMHYDTTMNDWHTCPASGRINASNPCFPGDARVHTSIGLVQIEELYDRAQDGEEFQVYTHDATAEQPGNGVRATTPLAIMRNGVKPVLHLTFSNGQELRCTGNHRLWTINRGYVEAQELTADDRVLICDAPTPAFDASWALPVPVAVAAGEVAAAGTPDRWSAGLGTMLGVLTGDGCLTDKQAVWVYGGAEIDDGTLDDHQRLLEQQFGSVSRVTMGNGTVQLRIGRSTVRQLLRDLGASRDRSAFKRVPRSVFQAPSEVQASFLAGLFAADGCVARCEGNATRYVGLGSASELLLKDVQRLLLGFGIRARLYANGSAQRSTFEYTQANGTKRSYASQPAFDLRISGTDMERFADQIGFAAHGKQAKLEELLRSTTRYTKKPGVTLVTREEDGQETVYNLTEPSNHSYIVDGVVVANCSEYLHVDNSACNLASLNLMKFRDPETLEFQVERFERAVDVIFMAQEILVSNSSYPTEEITRNAKAMRQLGLGYANLGALLMARGFPYDSDEGRAYAAAITAIMTGRAYRKSAEMAGRIGPFEEYPRNADAMLRVIRKHRAAVANIDAGVVPDEMMTAARRAWDEALAVGEANGYRNAQATVLAPTGTISFMMDCDTTGVEPDFSLVKSKKLVGGGDITIVNQTVPTALSKLGYAPHEIDQIVAYVNEHNTVVGAPGFKADHMAVFDVAVGDRAIHHMGHVKMMASVQPFISGAISKTVNLPNDVTVDDVAGLYLDAWKLGVKAIAIYRDGCKVAQPLSGKEKTPELIVAKPQRRVMPIERQEIGRKFKVGEYEGYIHVGLFPEGDPGDVFVDIAKEGTTLAGLMNAFMIAVSVGIQYGVPLEVFVSKFAHMRFEPSGLTNDPDIRVAKSIPDYIFRWMGKRFLDAESQADLGIMSQAVRDRMAAGYDAHEAGEGDPAGEVMAMPSPGQTALFNAWEDAVECAKCGGRKVRTGACYTCRDCGDNSGCG
jgi:ribonucleotide reductase alpha subunit